MLRAAWIAGVLIGGCHGSSSSTETPSVSTVSPSPSPSPTPSPSPAPEVTTVVAPPDAASATAVDASTAAPSEPASKIVDAPMAWSDERAALTLEYRRLHSDPAATDLVIDPQVIILHYTAGGSAKGTRDYFDNLKIESARKQLASAGSVNVSSHYIVDRDGTIYRLQPETRFARHCIGMNHVAIGIENVGDESKWPLTQAQVDADAALVHDLVRRYPHITTLLGHYEVTTKHSSFYKEIDPKYRNDKPDPGKKFMAAVRAKVTDLRLAGAE